MEGRLPRREGSDSPDRHVGFWRRCYVEGAKFCGLGVLFEEPPTLSDSDGEHDDDSDSDSEESRTRRRRMLQAKKSFFQELSTNDLDDELKFRAEMEEKQNLYPSPAIMDVLFAEMKESLLRNERRITMEAMSQKSMYAGKALRRSKRRKFTWLLHRFVHSRFFELVTGLMIFYSMVVCGIVANQPEKYDGSAFEEISFLVLNIAFAVEVVLRVLSSGIEYEDDRGVTHLVKPNPRQYFHDVINNFDIVITLLSFLEYMIPDNGSGSTLDAVRTLRLIRLLRLLRIFEDMRVILDGVLNGILNIVWILLLLAAVVYIYAVLGVSVFGVNDPRNFRNLGTAVKTVFSLATMSGWLEFLYINYHGCADYGYTGIDAPYCTAPDAKPIFAVFYMMSLVVILGNIMTSLFIGVITNKMEEATEQLKKSKSKNVLKKVAARVDGMWKEPDLLVLHIGENLYEQLIYHLNLLSGVKKEGEKRPLPPMAPWKKFQMFLRRVIQNPVFEWAVMLVILAAGIIAGVTASASSTKTSGWEKDSELAFMIVFSIELGIKFFSFLDRELSFFFGAEKWWNLFDSAVVVIGFIPSSSPGAAVAVRLCRLMRIMRLVRMIKPLQIVILSLVAGFNSIIYVALFMIIMFFVYAVAAVQVFRRNDAFHFGKLSSGVVTLFTVSFLEDWRPVFDINYNGCNINLYGDVDDARYYSSVIGMEWSQNISSTICPNPQRQRVFAVIFFFSYILVSGMVLVSAFVGIIVTSMQSASETVARKLEIQQRIDKIAHYFQLSHEAVKNTGDVYTLLDSGFQGAITERLLLQKMEILDIPTNEEFLKRTFATVNGITDTPFDEADFLLLTALAERARKTQTKMAQDDDDDDDEEGLSDDPDWERGTFVASKNLKDLIESQRNMGKQGKRAMFKRAPKDKV